MKQSRPATPLLLCATAAIAALHLATATPARADIVQRETDTAGIRLGQHIYVDDGTCPSGQIKDVTGIKLTSSGVARVRKCVERKGKR